jgi:hypothetical protein
MIMIYILFLPFFALQRFLYGERIASFIREKRLRAIFAIDSRQASSKQTPETSIFRV